MISRGQRRKSFARCPSLTQMGDWQSTFRLKSAGLRKCCNGTMSGSRTWSIFLKTIRSSCYCFGGRRFAIFLQAFQAPWIVLCIAKARSGSLLTRSRGRSFSPNKTLRLGRESMGTSRRWLPERRRCYWHTTHVLWNLLVFTGCLISRCRRIPHKSMHRNYIPKPSYRNLTLAARRTALAGMSSCSEIGYRLFTTRVAAIPITRGYLKLRLILVGRCRSQRQVERSLQPDCAGFGKAFRPINTDRSRPMNRASSLGRRRGDPPTRLPPP